MLLLELEALLGPEASGEISLEVSSPGAERQLQLPRDLYRFQQLPLRVEYKAQDGADAVQVGCWGEVNSLARRESVVVLVGTRNIANMVLLPHTGSGPSVV